MTKKFIPFIIIWFISVGFTSVALAGPWDGNWETNYGQLRLVQSGDRVFGDYGERGAIEAKVSGDGRHLRGVFVYTDGRWGTIDWSLNNEKFAGTWSWGNNGMTKTGDTKWSGQKSSNRPSLLKFADIDVFAWPESEPLGARNPLARWISFKVERSETPVGNDGITEDYGPWFGGYVLSDTEDTYEILLYIDQIGFGQSGFADLSIIFQKNSKDCAATMYPAFCRELQNNQEQGIVYPKVTGVLMQNSESGREMLIAFELAGDKTTRILRISRAETYYFSSVIHPKRGVDFKGFVDSIPHLCEVSTCTNEVVESLRRNPNAYIGVFADRSFLSRYDKFK